MTIADEVQAWLAHFTPTAQQRREFAAKGWAMPDGSYYIRPLPEGRMDLSNAVQAVGRATATNTPRPTDEAQRNAVRRHCMKRARILGLTDMIPASWNADGTLKQSELNGLVLDYLKHFGVRGMRWGVRNFRRASSSQSPRSQEAAQAFRLQQRVSRSGTSSLSNAELRALVNRMNLEQQYAGLNQKHVSAGRKWVNNMAAQVAQQQAQQFASKYAAKGVEEVIKRYGPTVSTKIATTIVPAIVRGLTRGG